MKNKETITLKNAVDAYLEHLGKNGTKANTAKVYRRALDLAITHFGEDKKLTSIMVPHTGKFYKSNAVNFHPSGRSKAEPTVKQIKRVFRQCMDFAKERNWITAPPIPKSELQHARNKNESQKPEHSKQESPTK